MNNDGIIRNAPTVADRSKGYQELLAARVAADPDTRAVLVEMRAHVQAPPIIVTSHLGNPEEVALTLIRAAADLLIAACEARHDRAGSGGRPTGLVPPNGSN